MLHIAMIAVLPQTMFHTPTSILVANKGRTVHTCQLHVGTWEQHAQLGVAGLQDVGLVPDVGAGHHLHHGLLQLAVEGRQVHPLPRLHHHLAARRPLRKVHDSEDMARALMYSVDALTRTPLPQLHQHRTARRPLQRVQV